MPPATVDSSDRHDRRALGDGIAWLLLGVVVLVVGAAAGWTSLIFIGAFLVVPALISLLILRRGRVRSVHADPRNPRR